MGLGWGLSCPLPTMLISNEDAVENPAQWPISAPLEAKIQSVSWEGGIMHSLHKADCFLTLLGC